MFYHIKTMDIRSVIRRRSNQIKGDLSLEEVAKKTGLGYGTVQRIFNTEKGNVTSKNLQRLARGLNVPPEALICENDRLFKMIMAYSSSSLEKKTASNDY